MRIRFIINFVASLLFAFLFIPSAVRAIGFSPAVTEINNIRNGNSVERTIYISRAQPDEKQEYEVSIAGTAGNFVQPAAKRVVLPAGKRQVPFSIYIEPRDVKSGVYEAKITFTRVAQSEFEQGQLAVLPGSTIRVNVSVTDKIIDKLVIGRVSLDADPKKDGVMAVPFLVRNDGNVKAAIDEVKVSVEPENDDKALKIVESIPVNASVDPLSEKNFSVKLSKVVPTGKYIFKIDFIKEGESIHTATISRQIGQIVLTAEDLKKEAAAKRRRQVTIYSGLLVVTLGAVVLATKKKKRSSRSRSRY